MKRKYKIFLGTQEIAGMMLRLHKGFDELQIKNDFYCFCDYPFDCIDTNYFHSFFLSRFRKHTRQIDESKNKVCRITLVFLQMIDILLIFVLSLLKYNAYIYIYGHGMFYYNYFLSNVQELEFFLLKIFRKKVIIWLVGSDSRAPYCDAYEGSIEQMEKEIVKRAKNIAMLEKYTYLIDNPASSHFHRKPYIIFQTIGIPVTDEEIVNIKKQKEKQIVILHAPSSTKYKGTQTIRNIIDNIKKKGISIKYIEVTGVPHRTVLEKIAQSDIVIDQLYSDTPMAGFATETSINGIPVLLSGYFADCCNEELHKTLAPTLFCTPEKLEENLLYLIHNKSVRESLGEQARKYVLSECMAPKVAGKMLKVLDNHFPEDWYFQPEDNKYIWGCGVNKECVLNNISGLIRRYGIESLHLDENSEIYNLYIREYNNTNENILNLVNNKGDNK